MSTDIYISINERGAYIIETIILAIIIILVIYYYNGKEDPVEEYKKLKQEHHSNKNRQKEEHEKLENEGHQDKKVAKRKPSKPSKPRKPSKLSKPSKPGKPGKPSRPSKPKTSSKVSRSAFDIFFNINRDDEHSGKDEASIKGEQGEQEVIRLLSKLKLHGHILNNVYIPTRSGTTELDIIYVNQYGIYVIESKNYAGFILGDDKYNNWVVQYRKGQGEKQNKFNFYSPVRQNETHIKHLRSIFPTVDKDDFKSIIVFVDPWKMKVNSKYDVIPSKELNQLLTSKAEKENKIFSKREVDKIYDILKPYSEVSEEVKLAHIKQVKKVKKAKRK